MNEWTKAFKSEVSLSVQLWINDEKAGKVTMNEEVLITNYHIKSASLSQNKHKLQAFTWRFCFQKKVLVNIIENISKIGKYWFSCCYKKKLCRLLSTSLQRCISLLDICNQGRSCTTPSSYYNINNNNHYNTLTLCWQKES